MKQKRYFVKYGDFANTYSLAYTETDEEAERAREEGYLQISRRHAEQLCMNERNRARYNPSFSGYADDHIWPYGKYDELNMTGNFTYDGFLVKKI